MIQESIENMMDLLFSSLDGNEMMDIMWPVGWPFYDMV